MPIGVPQGDEVPLDAHEVSIGMGCPWGWVVNGGAREDGAPQGDRVACGDGDPHGDGVAHGDGVSRGCP